MARNLGVSETKITKILCNRKILKNDKTFYGRANIDNLYN